jgi:hypothetical protein
MIGATGGSRFYAASRLGGKDRFNNSVTITASCLIIILSVVTLVAKFDSYHIALITIGNIALSVAVLSFSAYQLAGNFSVNAELMHRSGLEINELRRHLESRGDDPDQRDINKTLENYAKVLKDYPINHTPDDYFLYKVDHHWLYPEFSRFNENRVLRTRLWLFNDGHTWLAVARLRKFWILFRRSFCVLAVLLLLLWAAKWAWKNPIFDPIIPDLAAVAARTVPIPTPSSRA